MIRRVHGRRDLLILSLCDFTGSWAKPWADAGYEVMLADLKHGQDIRLLQYLKRPVFGILAAPPCTAFAVSGAQFWKQKDKDGRLLEGLAIVDACMRIILMHQPTFWALENPVGRLRRWLGPPRLIFNPCDYSDPYTKRTLLWGYFRNLEKLPVDPTEGSKMWRDYGGKSERTKMLRSITPPSFAKQFYKANRRENE